MNDKNLLKNKIKGSLIGSAIGDGFGSPTEFMKVDEIKRKWGKNGLQEPIGKIIKVTDDTQMAISVSKALMKSYKESRVNKILFETNLMEEFVIWLNDDENNRAPGMTCIDACEKLEKGLNWKDAMSKNSKGCGANMRVIPVGLLKFKNSRINNQEISELSQIQSAITHGHPTALAASDLTAITIVKIIEGVNDNELLDKLKQHCFNQRGNYYSETLNNIWERPGVDSPENFINRGWDECLNILEKVEKALTMINVDEDPCDFTGEGWIAEEAFGTALLCYLLNSNNPEKALIRAVNTKGDSDSIACLTGGFVGAKNGINSIPNNWIQRIEYKVDLEKFIDFIVE